MTPGEIRTTGSRMPRALGMSVRVILMSRGIASVHLLHGVWSPVDAWSVRTGWNSALSIVTVGSARVHYWLVEVP